MGAYTDRLHNRAKAKRIVSKIPRLTGCAIIRGQITHSCMRGSHSQIRSKLGDTDIYTSNPSDIEGFIDSDENFLTRAEAAEQGQITGQVSPNFGRRLLSSDIRW